MLKQQTAYKKYRDTVPLNVCSSLAVLSILIFPCCPSHAFLSKSCFICCPSHYVFPLLSLSHSFEAAGYDHLVKNIIKSSAGVVNTAASATKSARSHFWRGFRSTVGSSAVAPSHRTPVRGRGHMGSGRNFGGKVRHHPYKRH